TGRGRRNLLRGQRRIDHRRRAREGHRRVHRTSGQVHRTAASGSTRAAVACLEPRRVGRDADVRSPLLLATEPHRGRWLLVRYGEGGAALGEGVTKWGAGLVCFSLRRHNSPVRSAVTSTPVSAPRHTRNTITETTAAIASGTSGPSRTPPAGAVSRSTVS